MNYSIVVAWHNREQLEMFLGAWNVHGGDANYLILQEDKHKEGCAVTKNKGIVEALDRKVDVIMVLDDDCYPHGNLTLQDHAEAHLTALEPRDFELYEAVTHPPSRGTPYFSRSILLPVAASMGFWLQNADYDAPRTLIDNKTPAFFRQAMYHRFFPFSGMNCAFKAEFWPFFKFDEDAPRFDDIFMGYRLQQEAYKRKHCINLHGPMVRHVRQSNVWNNLHVESHNLERNETEWKKYV